MTFDTFQEYVQDLLNRAIPRLKKEIPDSGRFPDVFEKFENPDEGSRHLVSYYGLRIFKMSDDIVADPCRRYVEAAVYLSDCSYKSNVIVCSGNKREILQKMQDPNFPSFLESSYADLLDLIETEFA